MSEKDLLELLPKLIAGVKNELLLFSIAAMLFLAWLPEQKILIFLVWGLTSVIYTLLRIGFNIKREKGAVEQFKEYLGNPDGWEKRFLRNRQYWDYKDNPLFQIEVGENLARPFYPRIVGQVVNKQAGGAIL